MFAAAQPGNISKGYALSGRYHVAVRSGVVTLIAARTTTAGQIFTVRWPSSTQSMYLRYFGARFRCKTAFTTAQEMGADLILAHSYTVNGTDGTAVDLGTTLDDTGALASEFSDSLITAGCARIAGTAAITAGTHTLDAHPVAMFSCQVAGIGDTAPPTPEGDRSVLYPLFDARAPGAMPIQFTANQGFVCRNLVLMGAVGDGYWDFELEWDEGTPIS